VSSDSPETAAAFAEDDEIPFPLVSDPALSAIRAWGVRHRGKDLAVPAVFVVDRSGIVRYRKIGETISDRGASEEILAALDGV